jgi:hypothetical protein
MIEDERDPSRILADLCLTIDSTDEEIEAVARHLDPDAPDDAVEAIRVIIEAVRAAGYHG